MTDKEIRLEIESLYKEWRLHSSIEGKYRCEAYKELLEFIDSHPEEPVSEDLEEEIKKMQRHYRTIDEYDGYPATIYASGIDYIARHFANWEKEKIINKACEWLEDNVFSSEQLDRNYSRKFREAMESNIDNKK